MTRLGYRISLTAPLPLGVERATQHALELRNTTTISYPALAVVMRIYHGIDRHPSWWQIRLKAAGAEARPHGNPFPHPNQSPRTELPPRTQTPTAQSPPRTEGP